MLHGYMIEKRIGSGSYGSVYLVRCKKDQQLYAMKKINVFNIKRKEREYLISEILIQKANKCEYIIKLIDVFYESNYIYIVSEYAENGDLDKFITNFKRRRKHINNRTIGKLILQLASALKYLHRNNIIHRDIKTSNVFLDKNYNIKLGDLGIAKILGNRNLANTYIGTPYYMAPELYKGDYYDNKCDVWSLGCIMYEMITLTRPFEGRNIIDLGNKIKYSSFDTKSIYYHKKEYVQILNNMLHKDPKKRCDISYIYDNSFLSSLVEDNEYLIDNCLAKTNKNFAILPKINIYSHWRYVIKEINDKVADTIKFLSPRNNRKLEFDNIDKCKFRPQTSPTSAYVNRKYIKKLEPIENKDEVPVNIDYNDNNAYKKLIEKADKKINEKYSNNPYSKNYLPKIKSEENIPQFNRYNNNYHNKRYENYNRNLPKIKSEQELRNNKIDKIIETDIVKDIKMPRIIKHSPLRENRAKRENKNYVLPKLERVPSRQRNNSRDRKRRPSNGNIRGLDNYYKRIEVFKENYVSPYKYNKERKNHYIYNSDAIKAVFNYGY